MPRMTTAATEAASVSTKSFDLAWNGFFTIESPQGGHRTFRIRTELRGEFKGSRVVGLLTGSNNDQDYTDFGFVHVDNRDDVVIDRQIGPTRIVLFRGFRSTSKRSTMLSKPWRDGACGNDWERFAAMLLDLDLELTTPASELARRGYRVLSDKRCRRCNRRLTTPESIEAGIGPECAEREFES